MSYRLNIEIPFTDAETGKAHKVGDVIEVNDARGKQLLSDPRKLVSLNEKVKVEATKETKAPKPAKKNNK